MALVYNKKTAAKYLNISVETLDRYKKLGKLPFRQIGDRVLFTETDLHAFLDNCAVPASCLPTAREKHEITKATMSG